MHACAWSLQPGSAGIAHLPGTPAQPPLLHHVRLPLTVWPAQRPSRADARGFSSQWDVYFDQLGATVRRVPYMTTGTAVIKIELLLPPRLFLTGLPTGEIVTELVFSPFTGSNGSVPPMWPCSGQP